MTKETEIEKLFSSAKTEFQDNEEFINSLSAKLDKVEYIKRMQDEKLRHYKTGILAAFVAGVIFGGTAIVAVTCMPADSEIISRLKAFGITVAGFKWVSTIIVSLFIGGSAICIASSVQDISTLKASTSRH